MTAEHTQPDTDRLLLTIEETARKLSMGRTKIYDLLRSGVLDSVHIGSARRITADSVRDVARYGASPRADAA